MRVLVIIILVLFHFISIGQISKTIVINPGEKVVESIPKEYLYLYPEFTEGYVYLKNNSSNPYKLNYNTLFDEIQYLGLTGDTIVLNNDRVNFILIGEDTFYRDKFYFKILKDYGKVKLANRLVFAYVNKELLPGNISTYMESFEIIRNGYYLKEVAPKDTLRLAMFDVPYLADANNIIQTVNRQMLIKLYPQRKEALVEYLNKMKVGIYDREAVEKMLDFLTGKK